MGSCRGKSDGAVFPQHCWHYGEDQGTDHWHEFAAWPEEHSTRRILHAPGSRVNPHDSVCGHWPTPCVPCIFSCWPWGISGGCSLTDVEHSLDSPAMPPVEDTAPSPSACLLFLQILDELRTAAQKERDSSGGLATKPHTESKASPPPLAPRTPEERDSLPLTPPCREMADVERGWSEEWAGMLSGTLLLTTFCLESRASEIWLREGTQEGLASPPVRTSKGFCLRQYRTPSPDRIRTPQALTSHSTSILPWPSKARWSAQRWNPGFPYSGHTHPPVITPLNITHASRPGNGWEPHPGIKSGGTAMDWVPSRGHHPLCLEREPRWLQSLIRGLKGGRHS